MTPRALAALALVACAAAPARAAEWTLRLATSAPDGTAWAREMRAMSRDVLAESNGAVVVKWYFGGVAGDEREVMGRMQRGQIDGVASGGVLCKAAAPSYNLLSFRGLFASREEAAFIMNRLKGVFEKEARARGFEYVGSTGLGPELVMSRAPVRSLAELRAVRVWDWNIDETAIAVNRALGLTLVPAPIEDALRYYDEQKVDAFVANPMGAVAFQWYGRTKYLLKLPLGYAFGCLMMSSRAYDRLPGEHRAILRAAAAKLAARIDDVGRQQDEALLGGIFEKSGLKIIAPSDAFRAELMSATRAVRDELSGKVVPAELIREVLAALADYRAEHR